MRGFSAMAGSASQPDVTRALVVCPLAGLNDPNRECLWVNPFREGPWRGGIPPSALMGHFTNSAVGEGPFRRKGGDTRNSSSASGTA